MTSTPQYATINHLGVPVLVSRCATCGIRFYSVPLPDPEYWTAHGDCRGPDCGSYDIDRDAGWMFSNGTPEQIEAEAWAVKHIDRSFGSYPSPLHEMALSRERDRQRAEGWMNIALDRFEALARLAETVPAAAEYLATEAEKYSPPKTDDPPMKVNP
jgi:hypothetical protein